MAKRKPKAKTALLPVSVTGLEDVTDVKLEEGMIVVTHGGTSDLAGQVHRFAYQGGQGYRIEWTPQTEKAEEANE